MVKDRSVMVPKEQGIMFSQLFFPIQGILVNYNVAGKTFSALAGADDPEFVQANPSWSPDGNYIVFARAKAYHLKNLEKRTGGGVLLTPEECTEFFRGGKGFTYDLYRIPFNDGKGGEPVAVPGASNNGMSNYFAKYSPNGKWIVFCRAKNFMLLMPDSELYIMPAEGGEPRRLSCKHEPDELLAQLVSQQ
jgi:Tol biopolymer transport system component